MSEVKVLPPARFCAHSKKARARDIIQGQTLRFNLGPIGLILAKCPECEERVM